MTGRNEWVCPVCATRVPGGEYVCHCGECHRTFAHLSAFDRHRVALSCTDPLHKSEGRGKGFYVDERGVWHWGQPKTADECARERRARAQAFAALRSGGGHGHGGPPTGSVTA